MDRTWSRVNYLLQQGRVSVATVQVGKSKGRCWCSARIPCGWFSVLGRIINSTVGFSIVDIEGVQG